MGNCLITKLKDVVNNDSLEKFGKISVLFSNTVNGERIPIIVIGSNLDASVTTSAGIAGTPFDTSMGQQITVTTAGSYEIDVLDKYSITTFRIVDILNNTNIVREPIDLSTFKFCQNLTRIEGIDSAFKGNISGLPTSVSIVNLTNNQVSGKVSDINKLTALTSLKIGGVTGVSGDISELNMLANITTLGIESCINITGNTATLGVKFPSLTEVSTRLPGTREEFAAAQVGAGRTSGTCKFTDVEGMVRYIHYSPEYAGGYEINTTP